MSVLNIWLEAQTVSPRAEPTLRGPSAPEGLSLQGSYDASVEQAALGPSAGPKADPCRLYSCLSTNESHRQYAVIRLIHTGTT